ncbi:haloacid dehalogenase [Candidatus Tenderia electrophaga]|jgi:putative hydrolase of the HAD superfamily|uniref:Haloacid dehalogenase n=1 Tax=Candidatus Tenderia electrophaga TaxID=1748243 RepID=A0A0S2TAT1_9GAMM|nr:haloacid dehalogenase [Candidatus Tenderia electrophaga]
MPDWNNISTVLLDMDGTLLDLNYDSHFWQEYVPHCYAFSRGLDIPTAKRVLAPCFKRHEGTLNWYCLDFWSRELTLDIAAMKREVAHLIAIKPGALVFLDSLRRLGKRAVLVTNAHPRSLALKLEHTRLDTHLDELISAHELGLPKEAPEFWAELQARSPFTPHRTLLVDDNLHALRSAARFGIRHLLAACHPDSKQSPRYSAEFPYFHQFEEITPPSA